MKFTHRSIHFKYMWHGIEIFVLKKKKKKVVKMDMISLKNLTSN